MNDPTSPFSSEIARLRQELERANQSIDEKLEQIEDAGMDVISLTRQVEDGRTRIAALEDDVTRLSRKDDRRTRRLQKMRCGKCRTKIDTRSIDADERYVSCTKKRFNVLKSELGTVQLARPFDRFPSVQPSNSTKPDQRSSEGRSPSCKPAARRYERTMGPREEAITRRESSPSRYRP